MPLVLEKIYLDVEVTSFLSYGILFIFGDCKTNQLPCIIYLIRFANIHFE